MAALLLSCFLILAFAIFAIAVGAGAALGALAQSLDEQALGGYVSLVKLVEYLFIGGSAVALVFGILGLRSCWSRRQPAGLSAAGTIVAVIALVLHVVLLIFTAHAADDMLREKPYWNKGSSPRGPWGR